MQRAFVITASPDLSASVLRHLKYAEGINAVALLLPPVLPPGAHPDDWVMRTYGRLADQIESADTEGAGPQALRGTLVIIDLYDPELATLEDFKHIRGRGWAAVVSLLILTFPEVHWVFVTPYPALHFGAAPFTATDIVQPEALASRLHTGADPLSTYVKSQLPPDVLADLDRAFPHTGPFTPDGTAILAGALNQVLALPDLDAEVRFNGVPLGSEVTRLLGKPAGKGEDARARRARRERLNRLLLERAFSYEIAPGRSLFELAHFLNGANGLADILRFRRHGFTPLFDPTCLRNFLRELIREEKDFKGEAVVPNLPLRRELAAAVDDEEAYAYLHAYTAYRFGYRSHVVTSYAQMRDHFGPDSVPYQERVSVLIEDVYLGFPDHPENVRLSDLEARILALPKLAGAGARVFVTVGHEHGPSAQATRTKNQAHFNTLRKEGKHVETIYKPIAGIFDVWQRSGLRNWLRPHRGFAPGYHWPGTGEAPGEPAGSHSAPGRLLIVSNRLLQRAKQFLASSSVPEAVHGALLALEAEELLGNRTPTSTLEAIAVKQQLEVMAECMFYGVGYNLEVESRFRDIRRGVRAVRGWFGTKQRAASDFNAQIGIINQLVMKFRAFNQFDEEQQGMCQLRYLRRQLLAARDCLGSLTSWVKWYFDMPLDYPVRFASWLMFLVAALWVFYACNPTPPTAAATSTCAEVAAASEPSFDLEVQRGGLEAVTTFFSIQPPVSIDDIVRRGQHVVWVTALAIVMAFVHLGIFVSVLFGMIARK